MRKFEELIQRLAEDKRLEGKSESATREVAVTPVLDCLGWETSDANEVFREFPVEGGQVDYCLMTRQKSHVLIEVKRTGESLVNHEEQLLKYSFLQGVPLAALTEGLIWWLYIPSAEGNWQNRKFFEINFHKDSKEEASKNLMRFLGKKALLDGSAAKEAQKEFVKLQQEKQASGELPKAWQELVSEPEGLLIDLLREKVNELSEFEPSTEQIAGFLQKLSVSSIDNIIKPTSNPNKKSTRKLLKEKSLETEIISASSNVTGRIPRAFYIGNDRYEAKTWKEILIRVCEIMISELRNNFYERVKELKGTRRNYFQDTEIDMSLPHKLSNGIFVETHFSAKLVNEIARKIIASAGISANSFKIEVLKK